MELLGRKAERRPKLNETSSLGIHDEGRLLPTLARLVDAIRAGGAKGARFALEITATGSVRGPFRSAGPQHTTRGESGKTSSFGMGGTSPTTLRTRIPQSTGMSSARTWCR